MIEVWRGERVESRHRVHVVVSDASGASVARVGDPSLDVFYRSAAKPFQALPLVEDGVADRYGLAAEELALCCASHEAEDAHVSAARAILAKAGLGEEALGCGAHEPFSRASARELARSGEAPGRIHNNCSGKHAGMLLLAVAHGWDPEGYMALEHPVQERMAREVSRWSGVPIDRIGLGVDGCGIPCFSVPLDAMATSFARFAAAARDGEPAGRIVSAMTEHPFMVGGTGRACTDVMLAARGRAFVKLGAEGVYGGGVPERGLGFAIKVEDGARRAVEPALVRVLELLDVLPPSALDELARWRRPDVTNTLGDVVGSVRADFAWEAA